MTAHYHNSNTHLVAGLYRNFKGVVGLFLAKGNYLEIFAFGRVFRVWATSDYR